MTDAWRRSWKLVVATVLALLCGAAARAVIGAEIPADGENAGVDMPAAELPADPPVAKPVLIDGPPEGVIEGEIVWDDSRGGYGAGGTCVTEAPAGCIAGCGGGCSGGCRLRCDETYTIFDVVFLQRDNQSTD
ncbi:MAG: hypothetical protein FJ275_07545, partial [Planctomycetes bacterium]|nr:hypothetical protein [Planctomycetota bacterium]